MNKEVLVEIKNLKFSYPTGEEALKGIDLKIYRGERLAILGANGSGKSTFFLNLNGVLTPQEGEIYYKGQRIGSRKKDLNRLRRHIGIVFQNADNQIVASTVEGEVSFGPMNLNLTKREVRDRVEEALERMNLLDFKARAPHYLSGGEKKRVTVADVIAMHPDIFVFDEPTAALDPMGAETLEETLKLLSKADKTIVISTHMVDFAWRWADRIVVFSDGRILGEGKPIDIFENKELLRKAHLKKPVLLEVTEILLRKGLISGLNSFPKDIKMFEKTIEEYNVC